MFRIVIVLACIGIAGYLFSYYSGKTQHNIDATSTIFAEGLCDQQIKAQMENRKSYIAGGKHVLRVYAREGDAAPEGLKQRAKMVQEQIDHYNRWLYEAFEGSLTEVGIDRVALQRVLRKQDFMESLITKTSVDCPSGGGKRGSMSDLVGAIDATIY